MAEVLWCDYAYPGVDLTGYAGVVRYLQTNNGSTRSKYDLTRAEVDSHHKAGRPVAAFWQDGGSSAGLGYDRGVSDAKRADAAADALKAPGSWPVHFAVDDGRLDGPTVAPYFRGVLATLRRPVGAYGSFNVVEYLHTTIGLQWLIQTSSWSWVANPDGTQTLQVSPHAWLLQRDHNVASGTSRIDVDPLLREFPNAWRPPVSTPMTADQRRAALKAEGLPIVEVRQWWQNDRAPVTGLPAGPKHGVVLHHTGGETTDPLRYASTILYDGRSDLPGPLCHDGLDIYKGVVYMVGNGRTNHAGKGDSNVKAQVVADTLPYDRELHPTLNDIDGNSAYYGLEMMYDGTHALSGVGWNAMIRWSAAHCRFHGWAASEIAHREHTNTKPDPAYVDLALARRDLRDCLALPPGEWRKATIPPPPPPPPPPVQPIEENDDVPTFAATIPAEGGKIYALVPGQPKQWLSPELWDLARRQWPDATDLAKHGSPYLEVQVDYLWAMLQPASASAPPAAGALSEDEDFEGARISEDSHPEFFAAEGDKLPVCADPSDPTNA